jgi:hypothetical protein
MLERRIRCTAGTKLAETMKKQVCKRNDSKDLNCVYESEEGDDFYNEKIVTLYD